MSALTRDQFREGTFKRDHHKCVACGAPSQDAHHIIERRLWPDSGYHLDNGASVCGPCHILAEQTLLGCDELRAKAGIKRILLPPHLYGDQAYDKWGNPVEADLTRLRGEIFWDESVQKILAPVRHLFRNRVRHPRTHHLPWSETVSPDDEVNRDLSGLEGKEIVLSVKMDGEQTTMYSDGIHGRGQKYGPRGAENRSVIRGIHARIAADIPEGWRVCGENLQGQRTIKYAYLADRFQVYGIWDAHDVLLPWDETLEWCGMLDLTPVKVLWRGLYDPAAIKAACVPVVDGDEAEGGVVRPSGAVPHQDFRKVVAKYVRAGHQPVHGQGYGRR